jgi:hypothetical protein
MPKIASLFNLGNFDPYGPTTCIVLTLMSTILFPAYAQSEGRVIISNERDGREVRVFSASEISTCKYLDIGEDEREFHFASNAVMVGGKFQDCLDNELYVARSNNPASKPEIVILSEVVQEDQPSITDGVQPSSTNQPQRKVTDPGDVDIRGVLLFILLIAIGVIVGIRKLSHKKTDDGGA